MAFVRHKEIDHYFISSYDELLSSIVSAGNENRTFYIDDGIILTSTCSIPSNINIETVNNGSFSCGNYNLTFNGNFNSDISNIFMFNNGVKINFLKNNKIYVKWFGSEKNANTLLTAIMGIDQICEFVFTGGEWNLDDIISDLTVPNSLSVSFETGSYLKWQTIDYIITIPNLIYNESSVIFDCPVDNPPILQCEILAEFFGAKGDFDPVTLIGTDDYIPIQTMVNCSIKSGVSSRLLGKKYAISDSIVFQPLGDTITLPPIRGDYSDYGTVLADIKGTVLIMTYSADGIADKYTGVQSKYCLVFTAGNDTDVISSAKCENILCWSKAYRVNRGVYIHRVSYNVFFSGIGCALLDYGIVVKSSFGLSFERLNIAFCGVGMYISLDANIICIKNGQIRGCNRYAIWIVQGAQINIDNMDVEGGGPIFLNGCNGIVLSNIYGERNNTVPLYYDPYSVGTLFFRSCSQIQIQSVLVGTAGKQIFFQYCNNFTLGSILTFSDSDNPVSFDTNTSKIKINCNFSNASNSLYSENNGYEKGNLLNFISRNLITDNEFRIASTHRTEPIGASADSGVWTTRFVSDSNSFIAGKNVLHLSQSASTSSTYGWEIPIPYDLRNTNIYLSITAKASSGTFSAIKSEYIIGTGRTDTGILIISADNVWHTYSSRISLNNSYKIKLLVKPNSIPSDLWIDRIYLSQTSDQAESSSIDQLIASSNDINIISGSIGKIINSPYTRYRVILTPQSNCKVWYSKIEGDNSTFTVYSDNDNVIVSYIIVPEIRLSLY